MYQHTLAADQRMVPTRPASAGERQARIDLAATYRLCVRYGWEDLIYTHISMRVPGEPEHFLINPFGLTFDEVSASNLVEIDHDGRIVGDAPFTVNTAAFVIHSAVHRARPEIHCVMHLHTPGGMALSMLECGLLPVSQHALMFYKRIGYHKYEGIALDTAERDRLVADLGPHKALILQNHGLLTCGETVAEAFVQMFNLEKAAGAQLAAMAASPDLVLPPAEICELTAEQHNRHSEPVGAHEWPALLRKLDREGVGYRD